MTKKIYQKPTIIDLSDQTVYGGFDTPMGQCSTGATPMGGTAGCQTGLDHTGGNCNFGRYPDTASCGGGSQVGHANSCGTGTGYISF